MSEVLPEGWIRTSLGSYITLKNGFAFKSSDYCDKSNDTIPVIRISDIDGKVASTQEAIHVPLISKAADFLVEQGDLLIAMSGATTGKTGIYMEYCPAYQNQRVGNIKLIAPHLKTSKFRNYLIQFLSPEVIKIAYGGAQPNISGKAIEDMEVDIPPLVEQQEIASRLDDLLAQVDAIKKHLDAIPDILKRFRQSTLAAMVQPSNIETWHKDAFGSLILEMRNGLSPKPNDTEIGYPILRISAVRSLELDLNDHKYLEVDEKTLNIYRLKENDLLFTRYNGSLDFVGICSIYIPRDVKIYLYPDKLIRVRTKSEKLLSKYAEIFFATPQVRKKVTDFVKSTSGQKGISGGDLKSVLVSYPSIKEQTEIVNRVEQLFALADQIEQQVKAAQERVNNLTQSILAKAFKGELTAAWRKQHPELISGENSAQALLEKIKATQTTAKPKRGKTNQSELAL